MLTDAEITSAASRLVNGKLTGSDVDELVSAFRLVLGPLEDTYAQFNNMATQLEAVDDTLNDRKRAAKLAAVVLRLKEEDFGVSDLVGELVNSDKEQRKLYSVYGISILWKVPAELAYLLDQVKVYTLIRTYSSSVPVTFVP
jgi:hypothetical protein